MNTTAITNYTQGGRLGKYSQRGFAYYGKRGSIFQSILNEKNCFGMQNSWNHGKEFPGLIFLLSYGFKYTGNIQKNIPWTPH